MLPRLAGERNRVHRATPLKAGGEVEEGEGPPDQAMTLKKGQ